MNLKTQTSSLVYVYVLNVNTIFTCANRPQEAGVEIIYIMWWLRLVGL